MCVFALSWHTHPGIEFSHRWSILHICPCGSPVLSLFPGCTRSLGSSVCISVPSHAQHHVASTVHWHCLCVLSCRYHGCPGQLLPLCLLCVLSLICVNTTIPVSLALSNVCSAQHTRTCSLGWLSVPRLPPGGQGGGAAKPSQCQACG